jgi:hypothetical protein
MLIAVNGTLMKGQPANDILIEAGAIFERNARTAPIYRLWNVGNKHPAMLRAVQGGAAISLELWEIMPENMIAVLEKEPAGLVMGSVLLDDGTSVLGILAEPYILADNEEITHFLGWREYRNARVSKEPSDQDYESHE